MILKVGYYGNDGIECYRYFDDFSDIIVADISAGYEYDIISGKITLDGEKIDKPDFMMFNTAKMPIKVVYIMYYTEKGKMTTIAALCGTVFVMNENGKTVDKY